MARVKERYNRRRQKNDLDQSTNWLKATAASIAESRMVVGTITSRRSMFSIASPMAVRSPKGKFATISVNASWSLPAPSATWALALTMDPTTTIDAEKSSTGF
jgi:hypothetical protein